ncbi:MAG: 4-(cytidine 5'-diphospho)-2-C-methyl-D-erythritol kinase, partial [Draconibacterium sp.]|nr:4-(cytidine 5'-diphospho)-2-C-methyl-D-erythritol kinase [Draconibacterium sp.]
SKRLDGYHNLETIFYPVKLADALEIIESDKIEFTCSGIKINATPENNLVYKAYSILHVDFDIPPVKIHLHKVIPFGAGLGGGSADAAFTLKMLNEIFNLELSNKRLENYASRIGADCPFFIQNKPTFAHGIGDKLDPLKLNLSKFQIVILKPNSSVSTPEAYKHIVPSHPTFDLKEIGKLTIHEWKDTIRNDFEKSVFPNYPEIEKLKNLLYDLGAVYSSMSGSGSAVFGIFRHLPTDLDKHLPKGIFIYR